MASFFSCQRVFSPWSRRPTGHCAHISAMMNVRGLSLRPGARLCPLPVCVCGRSAGEGLWGLLDVACLIFCVYILPTRLCAGKVPVVQEEVHFLLVLQCLCLAPRAGVPLIWITVFTACQGASWTSIRACQAAATWALAQPCRVETRTSLTGGPRQLWCLWPADASQSLFCSRAAVRKGDSLACQNSWWLRKLLFMSVAVSAET